MITKTLKKYIFYIMFVAFMIAHATQHLTPECHYEIAAADK